MRQRGAAGAASKGVSWRWLCRLKWASSAKAGIFAFAFQSVAVPQANALRFRLRTDHKFTVKPGPYGPI